MAGHPELVLARHLAEAAPAVMGLQDDRGNTPLALAAANKNLAAVDFLLRQGCPFETTDRLGAVPLQWVRIMNNETEDIAASLEGERDRRAGLAEAAAAAQRAATAAFCAAIRVGATGRGLREFAEVHFEKDGEEHPAKVDDLSTPNAADGRPPLHGECAGVAGVHAPSRRA